MNVLSASKRTITGIEIQWKFTLIILLKKFFFLVGASGAHTRPNDSIMCDERFNQLIKWN